MHYIIYLIPFIGAFAGWLVNYLAVKLLFSPSVPKSFLGIQFQGILPKNQKKIADSLGKLANEEVKPYINELETKITSASNIDKMMPFVEKHIDHFLRVKLAERMPVISMFIGESTIAELKSVFLEELKELFPELMKNYIDGMKEDMDVEQLVATKIEAIQTNQLEALLKHAFGKQLNALGVFSATIGFLIGLIQLLIVLLAR